MQHRCFKIFVRNDTSILYDSGLGYDQRADMILFCQIHPGKRNFSCLEVLLYLGK